MANVSKVDSNATELRIAEELSVGVLPATPVWVLADPNGYQDFGGEVKTVARNPINASRQRKKGVVVDVNAKGGFDIDLTQDNMQSLMQGFLFADTRTNLEIATAVVGGTPNDYEPASGGASYFAGNLLFAKNFTQTPNNGLKVVTGTPTASSVAVTDVNLVDEAGASGIISRVGHEFASGVASIDVSGTLPKLVVSGIVAASQVLTTTGVFANGETVTINGVVYTMQSVLTNVANNVKIAGTAALTLTNLANAINRNGLGIPGTDFAALTVANPYVTATSTSTTLTITAIIAGTTGNAYTTTETVVNATWGAATMTGGTGRSLLELGLIVGQWVCIGDDGANQSFVTDLDNNGLKRVRAITNTSLTFDKSTGVMGTDTGSGKTIRIFFGRVNKNESTTSLIKRRTYQLERNLGAPDDALPNQVQGEYLTGSVANEFEVDAKQADKVTCKLSFMSRDHETKTSVEGLKAGLRPVLVDADAFNSTSHIARLSIAAIDPLTATPTDLFAFLLSLKLTINNNVKPNKALKFLGSFDNTAGTLEVAAEVEAYFTKVEAIRSVRTNADATLDVTFANNKKGMTIDLPLVALGKALADVKQDEAIMLPITADAATGAKIDPLLNHTVLVQFWDYLPTLAV
jgi:hypothetical protein